MKGESGHNKPKRNDDLTIQAVAVYCASSHSIDPVYFNAARELGELIGRSGRTLVYGGGSLGLMGELAEAVHRAGGKVHGVITERLTVAEQARETCDNLEIVQTMRERKKRMEELADAFLALPGGIGTFEELIEILVGRLLGEHDAPIILVNVKNYFRGLLALFDHAIEEGFMRPEIRDLFEVVDTPERAMRLLAKVDSNLRA